jgi:hypothetical protein
MTRPLILAADRHVHRGEPSGTDSLPPAAGGLL